MARIQSFVSLPGSYKQTMLDKATGSVIGSPTTVGGQDTIRSYSNKSDPIGSMKVGWNPPKAYSSKFYTHKPLYGTHIAEQFGFPQLRLRMRQGCLSAGTIPFGAVTNWDHIPDSYVNECLTDALNKLKDQKINLPVTFAERKQTAAMFESTAKSLVKAYRNFRNGRFKEAFSSLDTAASRYSRRQFRSARRNLGLNPRDYGDHWLKFKLGVVPMLNDLYGAVEQLHKSEKVRPPMITVESKRSVNTRNEVLKHYIPLWSLRETDQIFQGCFIRLDYLYPGDFQREWTELGITNPLSVAWELVPNSFMVDWFLPIGNYLSSLDAALGLTFRGGSLSRLVRLRRTGVPGPTVPPIYRQEFFGESKLTKLDRSVYLSSPLPDFPSFHVSLTKEKVASGLSILRQLLARR